MVNGLLKSLNKRTKTLSMPPLHGIALLYSSLLGVGGES